MSRLHQRLLKASFSIIDQGLLSGANFVLAVSLARVLPADGYGAFSLSFSLFLLIAGIQNALLFEPMSVIGPARYAVNLQSYLGHVIWTYSALAVFLAFVGVISSVAYRTTALGPALLAMFAGSPCVLLYWLLRRAHYLETRPDLAAASSGIYCLTLAAVSLALWRLHSLTAPSALCATAVAGIAASLFSFRHLGFKWWPGTSSLRDLLPIAREHWDFGKWILPSALFYPLLSQVQLFVAGAYLGLADAGVFRALQNPLLPVLQIVTALATLTGPILARQFAVNGTAAVYRRGLIYMGAMVAVALAYEGGVLLTGDLWDRILYGGRYGAYTRFMPVLGIMAIATSVATGCSSILRALQLPGITTIANLIGGVFGAASAFTLIQMFRLPGAIYGLVGSHVVVAVASILLLFVARSRRLRRATGNVPSEVAT